MLTFFMLLFKYSEHYSSFRLMQFIRYNEYRFVPQVKSNGGNKKNKFPFNLYSSNGTKPKWHAEHIPKLQPLPIKCIYTEIQSLPKLPILLDTTTKSPQSPQQFALSIPHSERRGRAFPVQNVSVIFGCDMSLKAASFVVTLQLAESTRRSNRKRRR